MDYTAIAARAYGQIGRAGAPVTFTRVVTTVDKVTGESTVTPSTVAGVAITTPGVLKEYEALKLIGSAVLTLLFAPAAGAGLPEMGATVPWGGVTYTVKHTEAIAPGGTLLIGRVIVAA